MVLKVDGKAGEFKLKRKWKEKRSQSFRYKLKILVNWESLI